MRFLLLLAILLTGNAWAATNVTVARCWNDDGTYAASGKCPPRLISAGVSATTTTSYSVSVVTDTASGTIYSLTVPVGASSCAALYPTRAALLAGTQTAVSSTGTKTVSITGKTAGTSYCTYLMHQVSGRPSNRITLPATTDPVSAPASILVAGTGYFVGTGGDNSSDGLTHYTRKLDLSGVPSSPLSTINNDIWIFAGTEHAVASAGSYSTKWAGSAGNPAYIACYYIDTDNASRPTACWEGTKGAPLANEGEGAVDPGAVTTMGTNLTLPTIKGSLTDAGMNAKTSNFVYNTSDCSTKNDSLLLINHSRVTVQGIHVTRSACRGITINPSTPTEHVQIRDSIVSLTGLQWVVIGQNEQKYTLLKNNIFRQAGKCHYEGCAAQTNHSGGAVFTGVTDAYGGMVDNTAIRSHSEGLQCFGSTKVWMKGNRVGNTAFGNYYFDACQSGVSESNIVFGTNGDTGQTSGDSTVPGQTNGKMPMFIEPYTSGVTRYLTDMVIRNNLFASPAEGMSLGVSSSITTANSVSVQWMHNTVIGARTSSFVVSTGLTSAKVLAIRARNNIFAPPTGSTAAKCYADGADTTYDYNLYGFAGTAAACTAANDIGGEGAVVDPALVLNPYGSTANQALWAAHQHNNLPDPTDAMITNGSHNGLQLNNVDCVLEADRDEYLNIADEMDYPYSLDRDVVPNGVQADEMVLWGYCGYYDYFGNVRTDTPDVGFHEKL